MYKINKNLNTLLFLVLAFVLYKIIDNYRFFIGQLGFLWRLLSPFIWAFVIAYLLNPLMIRIQNSHKNMNRLLSIAIIYLVFIGTLIVLATVITPVIIASITDIIDKLPDYINNTEKIFNDSVTRFSFLDELGIREYLGNNLEELLNKVLNYLNLTLSGVINSIIGITSGVAKMILAIFISFYMLLDKEKFHRGIKRNMYAFFGEEKTDKIYQFAGEVNNVFANFLIGKFIDSAIIGVLCYIGLSLMKIEFALLFSIIIGITNMIPYFGPFIGAVPALVITLFINPVQALWVGLFILALQQFDGLILGPKILGDKVGVSPFYIMLAIIVGGGFFGPVGMLLGVPVLKSFFILWEELLENKLRKKEIEM